MNQMNFELQADLYTLPKQARTGIIFREIGISSNWEKEIPTGYAHVKIFVIEGTLELTVDRKTYVLQRGDFLDSLNQSVQLQRTSSNARAFLLQFSEEFLRQALREKHPFPPTYLLRILQNPVIRIPLVHFSTVIRGMEHIRQAIANSPRRFSQEILQSKVLIFVLEMADILVNEANVSMSLNSGKHAQILSKFLLLLQEHIRDEHSVNFYAAQLNITPQYLRRIVRGTIGDSVYQVISNNLNQEICKLLLETNLTLQAIADELHFSDQAVLSKFFKRNNGISPQKYRNEQK